MTRPRKHNRETSGKTAQSKSSIEAIVGPFRKMKTATMISTALFATAHAFAPRANVAYRQGATRAFSRATSVLMANPKGRWSLSFWESFSASPFSHRALSFLFYSLF
jgi:hypothetical protein